MPNNTIRIAQLKKPSVKKYYEFRKNRKYLSKECHGDIYSFVAIKNKKNKTK